MFLLHGGPGAPGYLSPVAQELAKNFHVIEPLQRGSGHETLTVARHIADLHEIVKAHGQNQRPALVGHSWGAMLALAYAAAHPTIASSLVLIGCGSFEPNARKEMNAILEQRTSNELRLRIEQLAQEVPDADKRLHMLGKLLLPIYSHQLDQSETEEMDCDAQAHEETWADMLRLQREGVYPAAFTTISSPIIMLHGKVDPHPGRMIHTSLRPFLPQLEYREWEHCGHYPWLETAVHDEFYTTLRGWLLQQFQRYSL